MSKICFRAALLFGILLSLSLTACGGGSGGGGGDSAQEVASAIADELIAEDTTRRATEIFGQNGNLYKPSGDETAAGAGNMVFLANPAYTEQFDNCEIQDTSGATVQLICINNQPWTMIPFSCFSNGNRQTWRAPFGCGEVAQVRIVCRRPGLEVTFQAPPGLEGAVCSRLG